MLQAVARSGGRIDAFVANAGVIDRVRLGKIMPETFDDVTAVNARGKLCALQAAAQMMPTRPRARLSMPVARLRSDNMSVLPRANWGRAASR